MAITNNLLDPVLVVVVAGINSKAASLLQVCHLKATATCKCLVALVVMVMNKALPAVGTSSLRAPAGTQGTTSKETTLVDTKCSYGFRMAF